jgi:hypothetical protein
MNRDYLAKSDDEIVELVQTIMTVSNARYSDWGILPAEISAWSNPFVAYKVAVAVCDNPATRTRITIQAKDTARKTMETVLRPYIQGRLYNNPKVTAADLKSMGLHPHDKEPTLLPVPDKAPGVKVDSGTSRHLRFHFTAAATGKKAKPRGAHGVETRWAILPAPPVELDELTCSEFTTRSPLDIEFKESERGKSVYYCCRWENTRGLKGPWGDNIERAIVP